MNVSLLASNNALPNGYVFVNYPFNLIGTIPANTENYVLEYSVSSTHPKYIYITWGDFLTNIVVERQISGLTSSIDKNNDLQQESNQLQQEQNDFLQQESSDSDVSIDGFNSVDSNDITSSGLTGVFTNIYNSINSWTSKDIKLPIPYTNTNITIPANYTYNMLNSFGGAWIITFISSIYYFIVARFIIYSITSIINSIKSGSILETDSKNNITTDML